MNHLSAALVEVRGAEQELSRAFLSVAEQAGDGQDFRRGCAVMSNWSRTHLRKIENLIGEFGVPFAAAPEDAAGWQSEMPEDHFGLGDLEYLLLPAHHARGAWCSVRHTADEAGAEDLAQLATQCASDTNRQIAWLNNRRSRHRGATAMSS